MNLARLLDDPDLLRERAYIGGEWVEHANVVPVVDPATGTPIAAVPNLDAAQVAMAVGAADHALTDWRVRTGKERGALLHRWCELIERNQADLARILVAEQGKPLREAEAEVLYAASFVEWFAEEAKRVNGEILAPHQRDLSLMVHKRPVGVVAAVTPWNFPLAMITRKAGPALAVGCTMVLKPSELTPLSALALARLAEKAGIPAGVFNVVTGDAAPIGAVLTGDKRVRKFTFTGSTAVGKMLAARCMDTAKRVSLELGGNAPLIVFDDADLNTAVEGAIASKFRNAGQTCVCANRLLIQSGIHDRFAQALADRVGMFALGSGLISSNDLGPLISPAAVGKAEAHVKDAVAGGGRLLVGGAAVPPAGYFFAPAVIADVAPDALLCREETFGPVAGLLRFETEEQAVRLANNTDAGLAAYVFTGDSDRAARVSEALEYGMVGVNTGLISTEVAPFGGIKESGFGREGSSHGVEDYLELQFVCSRIATGRPQASS